jgi:flagellar basal-body rod modification protein FlgD
VTTNTTIGGSNATLQNLINNMNGTTGSSTSSTSSTSNSTSASSLQSTFLQLLVTQLQNQDPTNPMDSSQMTSQLAEINTVSGISQLNTTLSSLSSQLTAQQQTQSSSLLGTTVLTPGSSVTVANGQATPFGVTLTSAATDVTISVANSSGQVVSTLDLGKESAGTVPVSWTPVDGSGNTLPNGTYTITATATSGGTTSTPTTLTGAVIDGVLPQSSGAPNVVLSNGSTVNLSAIAAIL